MINRHSCGGRLHRIDLLTQYIVEDGRRRLAMVDADPKRAHWACDKCGKTFTQSKRQIRGKK